ncbi:MAG: LysM peptidoglycan-binding domain-containing protein [Anaerolineales bacterium]|nr:LysM peptidoglycan-binding domain-containing protein [Anaerolineales bacterium]
MNTKTGKPNFRASLTIVTALITLLTLFWTAADRLSINQVVPARAAPVKQIPIYTPTAGPDGRIIYVVKLNDTLLGISLLYGITIEELRELNNLTSDTIVEGQRLILGFAGPAEVTITVGPTATPTPVLPTATPKPGRATLCIILYNDVNGDSIRQEEETSIPDGAISFGNSVGTVSQSVTSGSGEESQCFQDLPEGEYTISVAVPEGYNATTNSSYELALKAGDTTYINFGAQANSQTLAQAPVIPAAEGQRSPILGIVGGLFLLAGLGFAIFATRMLRGK